MPTTHARIHHAQSPAVLPAMEHLFVENAKLDMFFPAASKPAILSALTPTASAASDLISVGLV